MIFLQGTFLSILNMSITASYVALGVFLIRAILHKSPRVFSYVLWSVVLFRLICPFSIPLSFSALGLLNLQHPVGAVTEYTSQNVVTMPGLAINSGVQVVDHVVNQVLLHTAPAASVNPVEVVLAVSSLVWVAGMVILLSCNIFSYARMKRRLATATRLTGNIFESDQIGTAFVCGFVQPKIYVPTGIGPSDMPYVLKHEHVHIRRRDYLIKLLGFLALVLHWFNPLMWLSFKLMSRDMEISCDEAVLGSMDDGARLSYSGSLLSLSTKRSGLLTTSPLAFSENDVKVRIMNVSNYKLPQAWLVIAAGVVVSTALIAFAITPNALGFDLSTAPGETAIPQIGDPAIISPPTHSEPRIYAWLHQGENEIILNIGGEDELTFVLGQFENSQTDTGFTVVTPMICGMHQDGDLLKLIITTYSASYRLDGVVLDMISDSMVPSAITFKKNSTGTYELLEYKQAKDGSDWASSIREFCTINGREIPGLADGIIGHYANSGNIRTLHDQNLREHLLRKGITDATYTNTRGEVVLSIP